MPNDSLTLILNGEVTLPEFHKAVEHLSSLVTAVTKRVSKRVPVRWGVADLQAGSAQVTVEADSDNEAVVEMIVTAMGDIGHKLQARQSLALYDTTVQKHANGLASLPNGAGLKQSSFSFPA